VKVKKLLATIGAAVLLAALAACGPGNSGGAGGAGAKELASGRVGGLTVSLANSDGVLRHGEQELTVTFKDASGKPSDVGSASLNFHMPAMGTMSEMNDTATLTTTSTPGVYRGRVKLEMIGEWQAQVAYEGPAGSGKGSFPVTAQ
jgi:hypothetical protein